MAEQFNTRSLVVAKVGPDDRARKEIRLVDGVVAVSDYDVGRFVAMETVTVGDVSDFHETFEALQMEPEEVFFLRAQLLSPEGTVSRRLIHPKPDAAATLREAALSWVMLDVDRYRLPQGFDVRNDPLAVVEHVISRLPSEFQRADVCYQFSSRAGIPPLDDGCARLHLFYLLSIPLSRQDLVAWTDEFEVEVDQSVFTGTQPHFILPPKFVGMENPLPVRSGVLRRGSPAVEIGDELHTRLVSSRQMTRRGSTRPKANRNALMALDAHCETIAGAEPGTRRNTMNRESYLAAKLCLSLGRDVVEQKLNAASISMSEAPTADERTRTIATALDDGLRVLGERAADWESGFSLTKDGKIRGTAANLELVLRNDPVWDGVYAFDRRADSVVVVREPPYLVAQGSEYPRSLADYDVVSVQIKLERDRGLTVGFDATLRVVDLVARERSFDRFRDFLEGLPEWDEVPRVETMLERLWGAPSDDYTRAVARCFMLSVVARAFEPGAQVDTILVLEGAQGIRKSQSLLALFPRWSVAESLSSIALKDAILELAGPAIVHLSELDSLSRKQATEVKDFVSRRVDRVRPPYGRIVVERPRTCVFVGSTNDSIYLQDPTGNRRFWPVLVTSIDVETIAQESRQLLAEAIHRYREGSQWWLTEEEERLARRQQETRYAGDPWEDTFEAAFERSMHVRDYTLGADLLRHVFDLAPKEQTRAHQMRLAKVMQRNKFTRRMVPRRIAGRRVLGWYRDRGKVGLSTPKAFAADVKRFGSDHDGDDE